MMNMLKKDERKFEQKPKELLIDAVYDNRETGSATCIVTMLDVKEPVLLTTLIGDCGFILLRKQGLDLIQEYRSKEQ